MARLTAAERKALPDSAFAGPGRTYPVPDKSHARFAKSAASRAANVGNISKATERKIDRTADAKLGKGGPRTASHANVRNPKSHAEKLSHC